LLDRRRRVGVETVAGVLRNLPVTEPPQMREDILALLDKEPKVPEAFRPNVLGVIGIA
jgi:hypothetical protein